VAAALPNASQTAIQYVMQMGMIGGFPASLTVGFITRKVRIKTMLLIGTLCILAGGLFPIINHGSLTILYVCAFGVGAGQGFLLPMIGSLILLNFEGKKKDQLLGLNMSFSTGGATVLLLIAGPVALSGWINTFYLYGTALLVFLIAAICLPKGSAAPPPANNTGTKAPVPAKGWIQCIVGVMMFVCYVTFPINISMLVEGEGLGNAVAAGISMSIVTVAGAALGFVFQPVIKVIKLFIGAFAAFVGFLGMLLVCLSGNMTMIYIASILLGFFFGAQFASGGYIISRVCKPEQIAPTFSMIQSATTLGVVLSPIIINFITSLWGGVGSRGSFTTSTVAFGVLVVVQIIWNLYLTKTCAAPAEAGRA
jgi:MFS family permease